MCHQLHVCMRSSDTIQERKLGPHACVKLGPPHIRQIRNCLRLRLHDQLPQKYPNQAPSLPPHRVLLALLGCFHLAAQLLLPRLRR